MANINRPWTLSPSTEVARFHQDDAGHTVTFTSVPQAALTEALLDGTVRAVLYSRDTGAVHADAVVPSEDCSAINRTVLVRLDEVDVAYNGRYRLVVRLLDGEGDVLAESDSHACPLRVYGEGVYRTLSQIQDLVSGVVADAQLQVETAAANAVALIRGSVGVMATRAAESALRAEPSTWTVRVPGGSLGSETACGALFPIGDPIGDEAIDGIGGLRVNIKATGAAPLTLLRATLLYDIEDTHEEGDMAVLSTGRLQMRHPVRQAHHFIPLLNRVTQAGKLYVKLEANAPFNTVRLFGANNVVFDTATYGPTYIQATEGGAFTAVPNTNVYCDVADVEPGEVGPASLSQGAIERLQAVGYGPPASQIIAALEALGASGVGEELASAESVPLASAMWATPEFDTYAVSQAVVMTDAEGNRLDSINGLVAYFAPAKATPITRCFIRLLERGPDASRPGVGGRVVAHRWWEGYIGPGEQKAIPFRFREWVLSNNDGIDPERLYLTVGADAPMRVFGALGVTGLEPRVRVPAQSPTGEESIHVVNHERPELAVKEQAEEAGALYIRLVHYGAPALFSTGGGGTLGNQVEPWTRGRSVGRLWSKMFRLLRLGANADPDNPDANWVDYVSVMPLGNSIESEGSCATLLARLREQLPMLTPVPGYLSCITGRPSGGQARKDPVHRLVDVKCFANFDPDGPAAALSPEDRTFAANNPGQPWGTDLFRLQLDEGYGVRWKFTYGRIVLDLLLGDGIEDYEIVVDDEDPVVITGDDGSWGAGEYGRYVFLRDDLDPEVEHVVTLTALGGTSTPDRPRLLNAWIDNGGESGELSVLYANQGSSGADHWYARKGTYYAFWEAVYEQHGVKLPVPDLIQVTGGNFGGDMGDPDAQALTVQHVTGWLDGLIGEAVSLLTRFEGSYALEDDGGSGEPGTEIESDLTQAHPPGLVFYHPPARDRARWDARRSNDLLLRVHYYAAEACAWPVDHLHWASRFLTWHHDQFGPQETYSGHDGGWNADGTHPGRYAHDLKTQLFLARVLNADGLLPLEPFGHFNDAVAIYPGVAPVPYPS